MDQVSTPGDAELWRRAGNGDAPAFGVLFERHEHAVRSFCHRRTGSADDAEDLTSITFLEAWRRRGDVVLDGDSLLPWLLGVAGNVVRHRWRTSVRHRAALSRLPPRQVVDDHADDVAGRIDGRHELDRTQQAFQRLRPADQEVLALCVFQQLDYAAAAIALGVPVGTVRSRLSRARSRLAALAAPDDLPDPDPDPTAVRAQPSARAPIGPRPAPLKELS